jgi:hypothetical protein
MDFSVRADGPFYSRLAPLGMKPICRMAGSKVVPDMDSSVTGNFSAIGAKLPKLRRLRRNRKENFSQG